MFAVFDDIPVLSEHEAFSVPASSGFGSRDSGLCPVLVPFGGPIRLSAPVSWLSRCLSLPCGGFFAVLPAVALAIRPARGSPASVRLRYISGYGRWPHRQHADLAAGNRLRGGRGDSDPTLGRFRSPEETTPKPRNPVWPPPEHPGWIGGRRRARLGGDNETPKPQGASQLHRAPRGAQGEAQHMGRSKGQGGAGCRGAGSGPAGWGPGAPVEPGPVAGTGRPAPRSAPPSSRPPSSRPPLSCPPLSRRAAPGRWRPRCRPCLRARTPAAPVPAPVPAAMALPHCPAPRRAPPRAGHTPAPPP